MIIKAKYLIAGLLLLLLMTAAIAISISYSEQSNFVTEFESRARKSESNTRSGALSDNETGVAYAEYEQFLDNELNVTYTALLSELTNKDQQNLIVAQRQWLLFRDAEFLFASNKGAADPAGALPALAIGAARTKIIRDRVVELLRYLKKP